MRRGGTGRWALALLAAALTVVAAGAARAWPALDEPLPTMFVLVCPSLDLAIRQAELSRRGGNELAATPDSAQKFRLDGCDSVLAVVTPIQEETAIPLFLTWQMTYDPAGRYFFGPAELHENVVMNYDMKQQWTKIYFVGYRVDDGPVQHGWAEIPAQPYAVDYWRYNPKDDGASASRE